MEINLTVRNNEDKIEKILKNIENLNNRLDEMNEMFLKKIQSTSFEKEIADKLHNEIQEYRNDLHFQLIKPLILDLINMRESMKKGVKSFDKKTDEEKLKLLQSYMEEIEIILDNNNIEIYETNIDSREDVNFDAKRQKIIKKGLKRSLWIVIQHGVAHVNIWLMLFSLQKKRAIILIKIS